MKNTIVLIGLMLVAVAGFSQMSKADAAGFLTRNPIANCENIILYNTAATESDRVYGSKTEYAKADIVSMTAMESGYSLIIKQSGVNREKFFLYSSFRYLLISSDNSFVIALRN